METATGAATNRVYNFSAGPATLPLSVLERIQQDLLALPGVGSSVMEISHRSQVFTEILDDASARVRRLMQIPDSHEVLFLQGGARFQNAMIPMNLITDPEETADYVLTGSWGKKSSDEVPFSGKLNIAWDGKQFGFHRVPRSTELTLTDGAAYVHYTSNETIHGVQFPEVPDFGASPLVCDQSSDIMCRPVDVSRFGLIYACAQKNIGIAGVTMVIIRKDLMDRSQGRLAGYLDYSQHSSGGSRFNTPPTFAIYVLGLVCKWLEDEFGGLDAVYQKNQAKANLLYEVIDASGGFYSGNAEPDSRSLMNVVFKMGSDELDQKFLQQADGLGMTTLKGHRSLGGIRASIYNAMPLEGVETLAAFMKDFAAANG